MADRAELALEETLALYGLCTVKGRVVCVVRNIVNKSGLCIRLHLFGTPFSAAVGAPDLPSFGCLLPHVVVAYGIAVEHSFAGVQADEPDLRTVFCDTLIPLLFFFLSQLRLFQVFPLVDLFDMLQRYICVVLVLGKERQTPIQKVRVVRFYANVRFSQGSRSVHVSLDLVLRDGRRVIFSSRRVYS
jgi:hypothetical protein